MVGDALPVHGPCNGTDPRLPEQRIIRLRALVISQISNSHQQWSSSRPSQQDRVLCWQSRQIIEHSPEMFESSRVVYEPVTHLA